MRSVVLFIIVCLLAITATSVWAAVDANAGICLPKIDKAAILKHWRQKYPGKLVAGNWQATQHDPNAQYIVRIYNWPHLIYTIIYPVKNTCATSYETTGIPSWWPSGVSYPGP